MVDQQAFVLTAARQQGDRRSTGASGNYRRRGMAGSTQAISIVLDGPPDLTAGSGRCRPDAAATGDPAP